MRTGAVVEGAITSDIVEFPRVHENFIGGGGVGGGDGVRVQNALRLCGDGV
jgi:hypothetical protein